MNEHDSERMGRLLLANHFDRAEDIKDADVIIVNTCCVREKAEQKFYSLMGRLRALKRRGTILGLTGCIAQLEKEEITGRLPFIDFSLGPSSINGIVDAIARAKERPPVLDFSENWFNSSFSAIGEDYKEGVKAFVTIMKGCDNFCSYCIVPYVRGREASRESAHILSEVEAIAGRGVKDVTLLGQNVNSYNKGRDDLSFPELLWAIDSIPGIERIRFVTSHPKDLSDELIDCFGSLNKLCEQIHLPFQAGSDRVLKRMNRGYAISEYMDKIDRLKSVRGDIAVTADCIVGFPGEGEDDFARTLDLIKAVEFDSIFSFVYSPRKFTAASSFTDEVRRETALLRLRRLQEIQKTITLKKNKAMEGKAAEVLVEGTSRDSVDELTGRTRTNKVVNFAGPVGLIGTTAQVLITKGFANSLRGELQRPEQAKGGF